MTEGVPQDTSSLKATDEDIGSDTTGTSEDHVVTKTVKPDDLTEIQFVIDCYVGQLIHGCGDSTCKKPLCATGLRNTSRKPVRDYTPRSARAIAITLASRPKPRSRLCLKYRPDVHDNVRDKVEGPRDPSAFMQHLSDTPSIRQVYNRCTKPTRDADLSTSDRESRYDQAAYGRLEYWHHIVRGLSYPLTHEYDSNNGAKLTKDDEIEDACDRLYDCIEWLRSTSPHEADSQAWIAVNIAIGWGNKCPLLYRNNDLYRKPLNIMRHLEHEPLFRLLCHVLRMVAERNSVSLNQQLAARIVGDLDQPEQFCLDIIVWLKKAFLRHWDGETVLAKGTITSAAIRLLNCLFGQYISRSADVKQCESIFTMQIVAARLDAAELALSYFGADKRHILNYSFLFNFREKTTYFRTIQHIRMRTSHSFAERACAMRSRVYQQTVEMEPEGQLKYLEQHYLLINVRRGNVLQDAFDQLWHRRRSELLRPLRVRLGETDGLEVGHDLGGVQIEFFNLVCKELLSESAQMFTTDPTTGLSYFRPGSLQPLYMFELCGLLFGLAVYNGVTLPINLPNAFYHFLFRRDFDFDSIADGWPAITRSLVNILKEDVPGLEWTFPVEANGLRLTVTPYEMEWSHVDDRRTFTVIDATRIVHHAERNVGVDRVGDRLVTDNTTAVDIESIADAWPGWHFVQDGPQLVELTPENKAEYVQSYIHWLVYGSVAPQRDLFGRGFFSIINREHLQFLSPEHVRAILEGTSHLDIDELKRASQYGGYDPTSKYIQKFWRLVTSWPEEKQKQLLKFVTATDRMPAGGTRNFSFRIERPKPENLSHLPTSSTCFRTLILPKYPSMEILDKKLSLAFKYGLEGFGTG